MSNYCYTFPEKLVRGVIIDRPNRFVANCDISGEVVRAHCPVTGSIGGFNISGLECLLSAADKSSRGKRSTTHTLEAITLWEEKDKDFQWLGINQNRVNRYVENAIGQKLLNDIPSIFNTFTANNNSLVIRREPKIGESKLDFLINNNLVIEVKTPLRNLMLNIPEHVVVSGDATVGTDRMFRQLGDISDWLTAGNSHSALLISVFLYDGLPFTVPTLHNATYANTVARLEYLNGVGLERYQLNFIIDECGVKLLRIAPY